MTEENCYNISFFKQILLRLRRLDDNIIPRLNAINSTSHSECAEMFKVLSKAYLERHEFILNCKTLVGQTAKEKKEGLTQDPENRLLRQHFMTEELQLRMIQNEFLIEEIIRERTLKVFNDKCHGVFSIPKEFLDILNNKK